MSKQEKKKTFDLGVLKRIFVYASPYKKTLGLAMTLAVILAGISPLRPYLIKVSVDKYIGHNLLQGLIWISVLQMGLLIIESLLRFWFSYKTNWLGQTVVNDIRNKVFEKVLFQNISYFDKTAIGTLTTRTINDIEAVNEIFSVKWNMNRNRFSIA